ncbi:MAG: hypothetical protein QOF58_5009 [Pseudonocardiales bacterium]|jgi:hypothetical protein|nr:hypothetical protein [Pseudonocardiales bacterium]
MWVSQAAQPRAVRGDPQQGEQPADEGERREGGGQNFAASTAGPNGRAVRPYDSATHPATGEPRSAQLKPFASFERSSAPKIVRPTEHHQPRVDPPNAGALSIGSCTGERAARTSVRNPQPAGIGRHALGNDPPDVSLAHPARPPRAHGLGSLQSLRPKMAKTHVLGLASGNGLLRPPGPRPGPTLSEPRAPLESGSTSGMTL